ncbi:unnamed protein product [Malus baccata var. baccata]
MHEELKALDENETWSVVDLSKGKKAVGSRWIYKTKFNSNGTIERQKAQLVTCGFTQTYGIDYKETFAPVAKMNIVRVLLSVAVNHEWPLFQMDVKKMFSSMVILKKSGVLGKLVVLIYMDDLIITGDNVNEINALKCSLHQQFSIKDLGVLKYFLGIEMATSSNGLFLNQRKYVVDLLGEAHMLECKPARTPLVSKLQLDAKVSLVSQFMHSPTSVHWEIVKRILRYLKGSVGRGILMKKNGSNHIMAYTDADWAGNAFDRKSTTGFCTYVGGNLVTWKSKKQTVVTRSSAEVEYRTIAAAAACELIWLKSLLFDLGFTSKEPMSLLCDN